MAPILPNTPSVKTFTDAWTKKFTEVVTEAAGKDGRLTITEAKRIAERTDGGQFFSDNATDYLFAKGQKSVSVNVLVSAARAYVEASAQQAAGADGKLSLADGQKLRPDLRDDFMYLRGKVAVTPATNPAAQKADVREYALRMFDTGAVTAATKLATVPATLKGRLPTETQIAYPRLGVTFDTYVADGHVYASVASQTPSPLVGFYDLGAVPKAGTQRGALRSEFDGLTKDVWLTSESDARLNFVLAEGAGTGTITPALVKQKFASVHDTLGPTFYGYDNSANFVKLANRTTVEERDADQYLNDLATNFDPNDPASVAQAQKFAAIRDAVKSELSGVKVYRFGTIDISVFIVGKTKDGDLAGLMSAVVET